MLCLTRKLNQFVDLHFPDGIPKDSTISVQVLGWTATNARIGIEAPKSVQILRREVTPYKTSKSEEGSSGTASGCKE